MSLNFSLLFLLPLFVFCCLPEIIAHNDGEDPTTKTMEDFSGYPIHEPHSQNPLSSLSVDSQSLQKQIDELSTFSDTPAPSVTRILYSEKDVAARREGCEPELAAVATGSHIDAIPYSGKYDGVVGVLGAIEAINVLKRRKATKKITWVKVNEKAHGLHDQKGDIVLDIADIRKAYKITRSDHVYLRGAYAFGIGCLGSRLMAGNEELEKALKQTVDNQNTSFLDAAMSAGYAKEQGPILEEEGISIGVVTAIAAPASIKVDFEGNGGHAGAVLMPNRHDAGLAAAELALEVEKHVLESGSIDTVGTVGILELHPGAVNSIPRKSHLEIDTRDIDENRRNNDPPPHSDESIIVTMEAASNKLNLSHKLMISRAYLDSLFMARITPMGMIFIPCYKGYSHKPEEFSSIEDIANGVQF
ncbi:Ureidoglycolate hydrolase [Camellia lanceoleosa]|uniref:Ureidoglycolate hydrolase n=1 Tax=Camellia lanceoleosa TaxID=1840588 RepID=A0ACC0GQC4_9ERIC|nr:Ureidoglycolate hydrolase [Camellia lanceoleosa]